MSLLPDRLHAAPPLTREELRRLDWDYERALRASRRRGLALSGLVRLVAGHIFGELERTFEITVLLPVNERGLTLFRHSEMTARVALETALWLGL